MKRPSKPNSGHTHSRIEVSMDSMTRSDLLCYAPPHLFPAGQSRRSVRCFLWSCIKCFGPLIVILVLLSLALFRGERWFRQAVGLPYGDELLIDAIANNDISEMRHA